MPGLASPEHGQAALDEREETCYTARFGMYHTGTGPTKDLVKETEPFCDTHESEAPAERVIFTLNTAIMAVGEGNYGRLGPDQQQHYMYGNVDLQLDPPDEQPGAMPEIAPSPDYEPDGSIDRPFNERAMVLQAWGAYGSIWPVVHQWLGVRPDLGRGALEVVPQVPSDSTGPISGENIRLGDGSVAVSAEAEGDTYTTTVDPDVVLRELLVGHTVPRDTEIVSVTLDGVPVEDYRVRRTNRGNEVLVEAAPGGVHTLEVVAQ